MIVFRSLPNSRYPDVPEIEPVAMLNPIIINASHEETAGWEACQSVPGLWGIVWRPDWVEVEYLDAHGVLRRGTYAGLPARVIQHETDHLDGLLFVDRVRGTHDLYSHAEMLRHSESAR